ncbi:MAG: hypothetical protein AAB316_18925, partial [Bacteroidota bacterium]
MMNRKNIALVSIFLAFFSSVVMAAPSTVYAGAAINFQAGTVTCTYTAADGTPKTETSLPALNLQEGRYINFDATVKNACLKAALQKRQSGQTLTQVELYFYD